MEPDVPFRQQAVSPVSVACDTQVVRDLFWVMASPHLLQASRLETYSLPQESPSLPLWSDQLGLELATSRHLTAPFEMPQHPIQIQFLPISNRTSMISLHTEEIGC